MTTRYTFGVSFPRGARVFWTFRVDDLAEAHTQLCAKIEATGRSVQEVSGLTITTRDERGPVSDTEGGDDAQA